MLQKADDALTQVQRDVIVNEIAAKQTWRKQRLIYPALKGKEWSSNHQFFFRGMCYFSGGYPIWCVGTYTILHSQVHWFLASLASACSYWNQFTRSQKKITWNRQQQRQQQQQQQQQPPINTVQTRANSKHLYPQKAKDRNCSVSSSFNLFKLDINEVILLTSVEKVMSAMKAEKMPQHPWYCWWTKSCTSKDDDYPINYRVEQPSQVVQDFVHPQYHPPIALICGDTSWKGCSTQDS